MSAYPITLSYHDRIMFDFSRNEARAVAEMLIRAADNTGEAHEFGNLGCPCLSVCDDEDHRVKP